MPTQTSANRSVSQNGNRRGDFTPDGFASRLAALMAVVRFGPEFLSAYEFYMLLFHTERTLAYGKESDRESWAQITGGIYRREDKTWIRGGSGLGKRQAQKGNAGLVQKGLLRRVRHSNAEDGHLASEYAVVWESVKAYFAEKLAVKVPPLVSPGAKGECRREPRASAAGSQDQSSLLQSKTLEEVPPLSSSSREKEENPSRDYVSKSETGCAAEKTFSKKIDDETPRKPVPEPVKAAAKPLPVESKTPEAVPKLDCTVQSKSETVPKLQEPGKTANDFLMLLEKRHSAVLDARERGELVELVKGDLAAARCTWRDFLAYDARKTRNPNGLINPPGHYRMLARNTPVEQKAAFDHVVGLQPEKPKCTKCTAGRLSQTEYCSCDFGRDLWRAETPVCLRPAAARG